jgi:hypothetical protein
LTLFNKIIELEKTVRKLALAAASVAVIVIAVSQLYNTADLVTSSIKRNDALIEEQLAYHYGVTAYLYGYPLVDMHKQMHNETNRVSAEQNTYAPINRFFRFPNLVEPETSGNFRAPNNDTLYYTAWFDISEQPLIIHTPDTNGRYFTIAITNQYAEATHIGRRTTGTKEGYFALVPPHWQEKLPEGVTPIPTETNKGWLLGRMLVDGPDDFDSAMALVEDVWSASLDEFTIGQRPPLPAEQKAKAIDPLGDLEFFTIMNRELKFLPPRPGEAALIAMFNQIGVGPAQNFDPTNLSEPARNGLKRAIEDGQALIAAASARTIPDFNGWMISKDIGRYGYKYMHRAAVVKGGYGNLPEESLYPAALTDNEEKLLHGSNTYQLHFKADQMPPVDGFWSLSLYTLNGSQLAPNTLRRYSIGDRNKDLLYSADGSLTITLSHLQPDGDLPNWLPAPEGYFAAVMRLYEPKQAALDNSYQLPRIEIIR